MNRLFVFPLSVAAMVCSLASTALADDAAYNTSTTDTVTIGTDPNTGGEAPGDAQAMQDIQSQAQDLKDKWSGDAQRQAVEQGK